jgi:thioredoxin 1
MACNFFCPPGSVRAETNKIKAMKNIIELTEANFEPEVLKAAGPVVVDFYAPWCGPCKMLAPLLEQLAGDLAGKLKFVKLNVDAAPELSADHWITGVPTLMLFRDGKAVDQVVGFPGPRQLKAWLDKAASLAVSA